MGRPRRKDRHLPPCVYPKHGAFWYVKKGEWTRLGTTFTEAMREYALLHEPRRDGLPELIWIVYRHKLKTVSASTAAAYKTAAKKLAAAFVEFQPEQVKTRDVAQLKINLAAKPNMANACVSFLRIVFDYALEHQLVDANPCVGVKGLKVKKRKRCPTDAELRAVHAKGTPLLQVIIELYCQTGQRVKDVLRIQRKDCTDQGIRFRQKKTDKPLTIAWTTPGLRATYERALGLNGNIRGLTLLCTPRGRPVCYRSLIEQWHTACEAAGVEDLQMRDMRAKSITVQKQQAGREAARELSGHTSAAQTERYIRQHEELVVEGPSFGHVFDN